MKAIQRLLRDDEGVLRVVLIDAITLEPVTNPEKYTVINENNEFWEPVQSVTQPDVPSKVQLSAPVLNEKIRQAGGDPTRVPVVPTPAEKQADQVIQGVIRDSQTQPTVAQESMPTVVGDESRARVAPTAAPTTGGISVGAPGTQLGGIDPQRVSPETRNASTRSLAGFRESYGPKRPNPPSTEISNKVREAAAEEFGPNTTVVGISGTEDEGHQHGSNRHKTKKAMDFDIEVNGQKVTDRARLDRFAERAATKGVMGIGMGYMGPGRMHMDTVDPETYTGGQDRTWGKIGKNLDTKLRSAEYFGNIKEDRVNPLKEMGKPMARPTSFADTPVSSNTFNALGKPTAAQQSIASVTEAVDSRSESNLPAGMRNNNPGNLKYDSKVQWNGLVGPSENTDQGTPQAVFANQALGMRATAKLAANKYASGLKTPRDIITAEKGWTPGYLAAAKNIANSMKIGLDDDLRLDQPDRQRSFLRALIEQEHGPASKKYTDDDIDRGIRDAATPALDSWNSKPTDLSGKATGPTEGGVGRFGQGGLGYSGRSAVDSPSETSGVGRGSNLSGLMGSRESTSSGGRASLGSGRPSVESNNSGRTAGTTSAGSYSSPGNRGFSMGLGTSSKSKDKDKDKDKDNEGATGRYGSSSFGGPR